jgi:hypothetical protein
MAPVNRDGSAALNEGAVNVNAIAKRAHQPAQSAKHEGRDRRQPGDPAPRRRQPCAMAPLKKIKKIKKNRKNKK